MNDLDVWVMYTVLVFGSFREVWQNVAYLDDSSFVDILRFDLLSISRSAPTVFDDAHHHRTTAMMVGRSQILIRATCKAHGLRKSYKTVLRLGIFDRILFRHPTLTPWTV